jgi:hypothetical protein
MKEEGKEENVRVVDIESRLNIDCYKCEVRCN